MHADDESQVTQKASLPAMSVIHDAEQAGSLKRTTYQPITRSDP